MKYFSFSGVAKRQEYWAITLFTFLISWIILILALLLAGVVAVVSPMTGGFLVLAFTLSWIVGSIWLLLATSVRRCRDADIHPLWVLLWFIPFFNFWWWVVAGCLPSVDKNFIKDEKA